MKIVCLGNEFVELDSLAVEVGKVLRGKGFEVLHIRNSFELMEIVSGEEDFVILDVVLGLDKVCEIGVGNLRVDSILSAHDFDAGCVLGLLGEDVKIIGIPMKGDALEISGEVEKLITN